MLEMAPIVKVGQLLLSGLRSRSLARIMTFLDLDSFDQAEEFGEKKLGSFHCFYSQISMNALWKVTTVLLLLTVTTPLGHTDAYVNLDSLEMEKLALVNTFLHLCA